MTSKKRNFKLLRLTICLVVAVAASSMFLTIEPMASENANPKVVAAQEDEIVEPDLLRAYSSGIPVTPLRIALQPMDVAQEADPAAVDAALLSLPEPEEAAEEEPAVEEEPPEALEEDWIDTSYEEELPEESLYEPEVDENSSASEAPVEEPVEDSTPATSVPEADAPENSTPEISANYSDLDYLAAICQIEAGYNYDGCLAVANVVLNRLNAGYGSSIYEVIQSPYQFATGWMDYYLKNGTSSIAREAAAAALAGSNNIGGYLNFNGTTWLNPDTLDCPHVVIDGNVFY